LRVMTKKLYKIGSPGNGILKRVRGHGVLLAAVQLGKNVDGLLFKNRIW